MPQPISPKWTDQCKASMNRSIANWVHYTFSHSVKIQTTSSVLGNHQCVGAQGLFQLTPSGSPDRSLLNSNWSSKANGSVDSQKESRLNVRRLLWSVSPHHFTLLHIIVKRGFERGAEKQCRNCTFYSTVHRFGLVFLAFCRWSAWHDIHYYWLIFKSKVRLFGFKHYFSIFIMFLYIVT